MADPSNSFFPRTFKRSLPLAVLLTLAGLAGNYFHYPIFFNIEFLFGSIFAMLALLLLGLGPGVLVGAIISVYTYVLWNHPYAIVILTAEVLTVGLLVRRKKMGFVLADALYWLIIGMPLVVLFYYSVMHLPLHNAAITMLKQATNGIANALLARLLYAAASLRGKREPMPMREVIFDLLVLFCLIPSLFLIARESSNDMIDIDRSARSALALSSRRTEQSINSWLEHHVKQVEQLAWIAAHTPIAVMQRNIEHLLGSDSDFLRIGLLDRNATVVAFSPLIDELGQRNIGRSFKDRPFIPILRQTLKPMLSEVVMGRVGLPHPVASALAPIVVRGRYAGYAIGVLDLNRVNAMIAVTSQGASLPELKYHLVDRNNKVIVSSDKELETMTPYLREPGEVSKLDSTVSLWLPKSSRNISNSDRWKNACYFTELPVGGISGWRLILEQPMAPFQKRLYERYALQLAWIFAILLAALAVAEIMSKQMTASLAEVATLSSNIPTELSSFERIVWPSSRITETNGLINNLRDMAQVMAIQFYKIRTMNENLEQRISDRTRDLSESEERFRSLFEKLQVVALIIDPATGSIIDANTAATAFYGWSRDHLLRMKISGINTLSDEAVQQEMKRAKNEQRSYFVFQHRRSDGSLRDVEVYSGPIQTGGKTLLYSIVHDVTERKRAEEALQQSEARFHQLFENMQEAFLVQDLILDDRGRPVDVRYLEINSAMERFVGKPRVEIIGKTRSQVLGIPDPAIIETVSRVANTGEPSHLVQYSSGAKRWYESYSYLLGPGQVATLAMDITERKQAEERIHQLANELQVILNTIAIGIAYVKERKLTWTNPAFLRMFGYAPEEAQGMDTRRLYAEANDYERVGREGYALINTGGVYTTEALSARKDGSTFWFSLTGRAVNPANLAEGSIWMMQDITERKDAEAALRESERLFRESIEFMPIPIGIANSDGTIRHYNKSFTETYGYTTLDVPTIGAWSQAAYPDRAFRERAMRTWTSDVEKAVAEHGSTPVREYEITCKDGKVKHVEISMRPIGQVFIATFYDISERKKTATALQESERFLRTIIDTEPECVKLLAADGTLLQMNAAGLSMIDAESLEQVKGGSIYQLIIPEYREAFKALTEAVFQGKTGMLEFEAIGLKNRHIWLETHAVPLRDENDEIVAALGITRDVGARRLAESALNEKTRQLEDLTRNLEHRVQEEIALRMKNEQILIQQSKLAAMGEMLGAIAHQWRQPLNALGLIVQNLGDAHAFGELNKEYVERNVQKSMSLIQHMSKTIDDFRNFYMPDKEKTAFDAMRAVGDVLTLFSAQLAANDIGYTLTCRTHGKIFENEADIIPCPAKTVRGYRNEFEHVILNLINNAREGILERREQGRPGRGELVFEFTAENGKVTIGMSDNGSGIPPMNLNRIFEPYFTTKDPSQGTGLGLYMSKVIIEKHMGGAITATNGERGAVFTIELAQADEWRTA